MSATPKPLAKHHYYDRLFQVDAVKVLPGEYYVTDKPLMVTTVLGSCVAACIRDRRSGIGGMNHFLLPEGSDDSSPLSESMRYGSYAMEILINEILKLGGQRSNLEAKVFGGGNVLPGMTTMNVGARNAHFVLEYLKTDGISVSVQDLLDNFPRRVCFWPNDGKVMVKKLKRAPEEDVVGQERLYQSSLRKTAAADVGSIDLF